MANAIGAREDGIWTAIYPSRQWVRLRHDQHMDGCGDIFVWLEYWQYQFIFELS